GEASWGDDLLRARRREGVRARHVLLGPAAPASGVTTPRERLESLGRTEPALSAKSAISRLHRPDGPSARPPGVRLSLRGGFFVGCERRRGRAAPSANPQRPRCRAITIRWTSFVPSPISRSFWSRYSREIGNSSMNPYPPWIWSAIFAARFESSPV